ncbi:MAG TPA: SDR family oxidoreductase [Chryseolinea sp.]|nr:SDR family oxidoreductase [Chryseolinea sp.]
MTNNKIALITGASKGLGYSLAENLALKGWTLLINARNAKKLLDARNRLGRITKVIAISGDVRDEIHLLQLTEALETNQLKLDLVVNNASALGVSPMPSLLDQPIDDLHTIFHTNMIAPISLLQKIRSHLNPRATIINVSSDAGAEAYENWGAYGGSKAGLDHMTSILAKENPEYKFYSFDPGDMRTDMHQAAFPGQDISDRPLPEEYAVPALLELIKNELPSGRYTTSILKEQLQ